jgi:hypothetical protein
MGRKGDTILAHINPKEAAMLKAHGGSGGKNPKTGLLEFNEDGPGGTDTGAERTGDYGGGEMNLGGWGDFGGLGAGGTMTGPNLSFGAGESPALGGAGTLGDTGYSFAAPTGFNWGNAIQGGLKGMSTLGPIGGLLGGYLSGTGQSLSDLFGGRMGVEDPGSGRGMATGGTNFAGGNTYEGPGYLPSDTATTTAGTAVGNSTTTPLYTIPPAYGNSPFTMKFGKPRDMTGLLNFGS